MADATTLPLAARAGTVRPSTQRLVHLQALRGLAASLVTLAHAIDALAVRDLMSPRLAGLIGNSGYFGVATFFMISGFIITKTSHGSFGGPRGARHFLVKRLIRIFPIFWIATALFMALSPHRGEVTLADLGFSALLVPHLIGFAGNMHPLVGQGWTLQYEMLFYGLFALAMTFSRRTGPFVVIAMLAVIVEAGRFVMPLSDLSEPLTRLAYWTRPVMLLFAIGIGFALLEERLAGRLAIASPFLLLLVLLGVWFAYSLLWPLAPEELLRFPRVGVVWGMSATAIFIAVFGRATGREGPTETVAEALGDASYSVYLFHTFILSALLRLKVQDLSPALFVVATIVVANVFGLLMYAIVEKPMLTTLRRALLPRASR